MSTESNFKQEFKEGRDRAVTFAGFVYTGAVVAATIIFLFFVLTAFPESAYFIRFLMVLAGLLVGASALAFPVALHSWAVAGTHRKVATGFYYGEICLIVLNTIVSFSVLLYTFAGNTIPPWVSWYEPFTISSLGYVILAWGTIFLTDPRAKSKAVMIEAFDEFDKRVANDTKSYLDSDDGKIAIQEAANARIRDHFATKRKGPNPWIKTGTEQETYNPGIPTPPQSASPRPASQSNRPTLPDSSMLRNLKRYSAGEVVSNWGLTIEQARDLLIQYELLDARTAYDALKDQGGYLPSDLTPDNFMYIFCEIMGVSPTWERIVFAAPQPLQPGPNGKK